ncbi:MAG TPA: hemolysin III family protein [Thermoleophilaceae bacterium]|nr:hemolysin III family protein [Thermoleophilaceae bacterium]
MDEALPSLRGRLHLHTIWFSVAAATLLIAFAPAGTPRLVAAIYGVGLNALFITSALYHRWPPASRWKPILRRIDHCVIFVFIAASYTPIAALVLEPPSSTIVLVSVWVGAVLGVAFSIAWIDAPRLAVALSYIGIGWVIVIALPEVFAETGAVPAMLFLAGGLLYSAGAVVYARKRPDPWPRVFGFHEIFHALVIAAAALHFVAMAGWVIPAET